MASTPGKVIPSLRASHSFIHGVDGSASGRCSVDGGANGGGVGGGADSGDNRGGVDGGTRYQRRDPPLIFAKPGIANQIVTLLFPYLVPYFP